MTRRLVEYDLGDGKRVIVEVEDSVSGGLVPVGRGDLVIKAKQSFSEALDNVRPTAEAILEKLTTLSQRPDEVEVTFGLKLSADAGAVIATAGGEVNYNIKLVWHKK